VETSKQNQQYGYKVVLDRSGERKLFISVSRETGDDLEIFNEFPPSTGEVAAQLVFGGCGFEQAARARMSGAKWPVLWAQGDVCPGTHLSGTQVFIVEGQSIRQVMIGDQVVGSAWSDEDADYCLLTGVLPANPGDARGCQTTSCMQQIEVALHQAGMNFSNIVRTWFYLDHLLDWYDEFNAARTKFFETRGVFDRMVPASTGIGASNPADTALAAGALAIRPRNGRVHIQEVQSPLQCPATDYRSSFSRAVEVGFPDRRLLIISGTASIAAEGASMFADDVTRQIHLTLDVVEAILKSREMDWTNTVRAVGYFRRIEDLPLFERCCRERGIAPLPLVPAHAIVCRDDLLFEIELDAIASEEPKTEKGVSGDLAYGN
jgi:enamine deaminase RidA (YjgF/YER057c/UK114 family)